MKPRHEKTSKRPLSHTNTKKLKVQLVLIGFLVTFWGPPNLDFQGPCKGKAQPYERGAQPYK
jgi:hypothetical protein